MKKIILGISVFILLTFIVSCVGEPITLEPKTPIDTMFTSSSQSSSPSPAPANSKTPVNEIPSSTYREAPVTITKQSDGQVIHVNLVKFMGSVSTPNTTVLVNNISAIVANDGGYSVLLEIVKGKNIIEIKTIQESNITSDKITITFDPPLAVVINYPKYNKDTDYRKTALTVTGVVNNPAAEVTLYQGTYNTIRALVASDGTYSAQMILKDLSPNSSGFTLTAVARSGDETDSIFIVLGFKDGKINGNISDGPYRGTMFEIAPAGPITVKVGDNALLDWLINVRAENATDDGFPYSQIKLSITRVEDIKWARDVDGSIIGLPVIHGLVIETIPSTLTVFPNTRYHVSANIMNSADLAPGTYYFVFRCLFNPNGELSRTITVVVQPNK
jgi:hypothetical protein